MQKLIWLPVGAFIGLALVACSSEPEHPEQHIQKLIEDGFNRQTLFGADKVTINSASCGGNQGSGQQHRFACTATFTHTDIIGTPNRSTESFTVVHDLSTDEWSLAP